MAAAFNAHLGSHGVVTRLVAALILVVGALDDRFDLPALTRLYAHILASITLLFGTGFAVHDLGDLFGLGAMHLFPLCEILTVFAVVALINGFNMLDGLDGLAGGAAPNRPRLPRADAHQPQRGHPGDGLEVFVPAQQWQVVLQAGLGNHAIDRGA